jgi:hypothetical protein
MLIARGIGVLPVLAKDFAVFAQANALGGVALDFGKRNQLGILRSHEQQL